MMNYRQEFKDYYKIEFSTDYEVHHIDINRENNDMSNLMILPRKLHKEYHKRLRMYQQTLISTTGDPLVDPFIHGNQVSAYTYNREIVESFIKVLDECAKWKDYKDYLDGKLCNIHGIKLH